MYFPSDEYRSCVSIPFKFNAVRIYGVSLHPTIFEISISCTVIEDARTPAVVESKSEEGMQRLNFWMESILTDVVIVDVNSDLFTDLAGSVDNTVMYCPGPPTDHLLVELLHSKITSITAGMFDIHCVTIKSTDTHGIETSFRPIDGYELPGVGYIAEEVMHPVPWWQRDTIEICEFAKGAVLEDELFNHFSDFFSPKKPEADIIIFRTNPDDDEDGQI